LPTAFTSPRRVSSAYLVASTNSSRCQAQFRHAQPNLAKQEAQAFDPKKNAQAALEISSAGTDWTQWSTFVGESDKEHLDEARQAIAELSAS
jgi:Lysozyme like domain